jgi:hypothetical protein
MKQSTMVLVAVIIAAAILGSVWMYSSAIERDSVRDAPNRSRSMAPVKGGVFNP